MNSPLVSVVIPCYNHEKFVQDSIQSVIDQTYSNIELIIIDDGSKDNSLAIIKEMIELCEKRFKRFEFRSRANIGLSATLNEALEWCQGRYFAPIASDDQMIDDKIKFQVEYLEKHLEVSALMGSIERVDDNNKILGIGRSKNAEYNFEDVFLSKQYLNACTQISRLEHIKEVGGYKVGCPIEDWYMWLKLSQLGKLVNIDKIFVKYRMHDDNTIKKGEIIYSGMIEVAEEYKLHPLFLKAIKQIVWIRIAAIILKDKKKGSKFFKETFEADKMAVFNKNFYRCVRNFLLK